MSSMNKNELIGNYLENNDNNIDIKKIINILSLEELFSNNVLKDLMIVNLGKEKHFKLYKIILNEETDNYIDVFKKIINVDIKKSEVNYEIFSSLFDNNIDIRDYIIMNMEMFDFINNYDTLKMFYQSFNIEILEKILK